jgi:hypothetical protein
MVTFHVDRISKIAMSDSGQKRRLASALGATDVRSHAMTQALARAYAYQWKPVAGVPVSWAEGFVQKP